jgi:nucleotide-binding universal stress UspA family protein
MTADGGRGAVVVGADGASSYDAVDWAAAEAATRHAPLVIVHAFRRPLVLDPYGLAPVADPARFVPEAAERVVRTAVRRARAVAPDLDLSAQLISSAPSRVLGELSRQAALLVLGGRPLSGRRGVTHRSASERMAGSAHCPVVVVRSRAGVRVGVSRPRVVLGVGPSPVGAAAIAFAFRAAAQRGIPLTAVHAWRHDLPADAEAACGHPAATEAHARAALDRVLEYWGHRFADVHIEQKVLPGDPATALIAESVGAALVVVGSRGRGRLRTRLLGSVGRTVVQRAHSPVVVAGRDGVLPARRGPGARRPMTDAA